MNSIRIIAFTIWITGSVLAGSASTGTVNTKPLTSTEKNIETLGTGVAIALPLTAAGVSYYKDDTMGLAQLSVETLLTVGTAYALKNIVREDVLMARIINPFLRKRPLWRPQVHLIFGVAMAGNMDCPHSSPRNSFPILASRPESTTGTIHWPVLLSRRAMVMS